MFVDDVIFMPSLPSLNLDLNNLNGFDDSSKGEESGDSTGIPHNVDVGVCLYLLTSSFTNHHNILDPLSAVVSLLSIQNLIMSYQLDF